MSYEILYDTQFIRSKSGITPAILSGSNNCTEVNWTLSGRRYERGERGWWVLFNRVGVSEEDFMANIQKMTGGAYQEHWKSRGKWVDDAGLVRWAKNAIRRAATVEAILLDNRPHTSIQCYVSVWENHEHHMGLNTYVSSTEEYDEWAQRVERLRVSLPEKSSFYPVVNLWEGMNHPDTRSFDPDEKVVLKHKNSFLQEYSAVHSSWSTNAKDAMILTYEHAVTILRNPSIPGMNGAKVHRASALDFSPAVYIKVTDLRTGSANYYRSARRYSIVTTPFPKLAKRFSPKNAQQAVKRMQPKYQKLSFEIVPAEE